MAETGDFGRPLPRINKITQDDISEALRRGMDDFKHEPTYGIVLAAVYVVGGLILAYIAFTADMLVMLFPISAGFALVGPFAAVTLYEVSRRRELGLKLDVWHVLGAIRSASSGSIVMLGFVLFFALYVWVRVALLIYALFYGLAPVDFVTLLGEVVSTWQGVMFFAVGNAVGALFALALFVVSVMSFPFLVDKEADFISAIMVSVSAVRRNPRVLFGWGVFVAFVLAVAIVPFFLGLFLAIPLLGHATWHLYRRTVAY
ncbi:MAG: DUF2189 domain-containing protein [Pseudomonadota bacterium]